MCRMYDKSYRDERKTQLDCYDGSSVKKHMTARKVVPTISSELKNDFPVLVEQACLAIDIVDIDIGKIIMWKDISSIRNFFDRY